MRVWTTLRPNGLYMVTKFKPCITEVCGVGHLDAYVKYGDPVGFLNISEEFIFSVFSTTLTNILIPYRTKMIGKSILSEAVKQLQPTHILERLFNRMYKIKGVDCYITNVCPWFVKTMFNIVDLDRHSSMPIHFTGEFYGKH
jgi:hypothetical protein